MAATRREFVQKKLAFRERTLAKLYDAYEALADGRVRSYRIDDRELSYLDLDTLWDEIKAMEDDINDLQAELYGTAKRKAVAVLPRDW